MKMKAHGTVLTGVTCLVAATVAMADNPPNGCDVVTLSGSGTRLESGVTVGSSTMTIVATGEQIPVAFTAVPLGITDLQDGKVTFVSSHDFKGVDDRRVNFTTFDEVKTVPLQGNTLQLNSVGKLCKCRLVGNN